jgi:enoyl-CoA hydratase/carnithine racemase
MTGKGGSGANGEIRLLRDGGIAIIELNRPGKKNAISQAMWQGLAAIAAQLEADETCRTVIVRGAGGNFSAGADIGEFEAVYASAQSAAQYNAVVRAAQLALRELPRPVIAMVEGVCVGGGCGIALACDLRFAASNARFAITPARLGIAYSFADTAQLVEKVGPARAKDILFSARMLDAPEALATGLVDRVHPQDALEGEVMAYAAQLSALSQTSIRAAKAMINAMGAPDKADAASFDQVFAESFSGPDFAEGREAFLARRAPKFL